MAPRDNEQGADPVASGADAMGSAALSSSTAAESGNTYTQVPALASASWSGPFCTDQFAHARVSWRRVHLGSVLHQPGCGSSGPADPQIWLSYRPSRQSFLRNSEYVVNASICPDIASEAHPSVACGIAT